jgi:DedD protein
VNRHYDSDNDLQEHRESGGRDREISLGTSTILGIFFVLAMLCAVFFGFGYSMGRRSTQTTVNTSETAPLSDSADSKPAPGSPANRPALSSNHKIIDDANDTKPTASGPTAASVPPRSTTTRFDPPPQPQANPAIKPVSLPRSAATTTVAPAPVAVPGIGSIVVQVAAVSHPEDAKVLIDALKQRGYSVAIRQVPQDKLLHVQIGPFASKKDADVMRQRLLADGYNAIVK